MPKGSASEASGVTPAGVTRLDTSRGEKTQRRLAPVMRRLLRASDTTIDAAINAVLAELGRACGADRAYVFRITDTTLSNTHEWCEEGVAPQITSLQDLPIEIMSEDWLPRLQRDETFVQSVGDLPEGDALRETLERQDIHTLVVAPLTGNNGLNGFIGLDLVRVRPLFDAVEIALLGWIADAVCSALLRHDAYTLVEAERLRAETANADRHRLARVVETMTNLVVIVDPDRRIVWANRAFEEQTGYLLSDILGRPVDALLRGPDTDPTQSAAVDAAMARLERFEGEIINHTAEGKPYWVRQNMYPLRDIAGAHVGYVSIETVIDELKALEQALQIRAEHLDAVMNAVPLPILGLDTLGNIVFANCAAHTDLSLSPPSEPDAPWIMPPWHAETPDGAPLTMTDLPWALALRSAAPVRDMRLKLQLQGQDPRILSIDAVPVSASSEAPRVVVAVKDITHIEAAADRLRRLAAEDPLTGIPNRRALIEMLRRVLPDDCDRTKEADAHVTHGVLVMIDIDGFRRVNATLLNDAGDAVLCEVARLLSKAVRPGDCVARVGGDEFVIVAPGISGSDAFDYAERLRALVALPITVKGVELRLTASAGLVPYPDHSTDPLKLLSGADTALHVARATGQNRTVSLSPEISAVSARRNAIAHALADDRLVDGLRLFFQPQFLAEDPHRLVGVEALLRWQHHALGSLGPEEFITVAEETGLITRVDNYVLRMGIDCLQAWSARGWTSQLSINVSPISMTQPDFADRLLAQISDAGVSPEQLTIEMTEGSLYVLSKTADANLFELRRSGVRIAIDDFGTGYASLSFLQRLPVSEIKIDKSFISELNSTCPKARHDSRVLTKAVIALGRSLGLSVVAEGVETPQQKEWLTKARCDRFQGYLLAKPMAQDQFEAKYILPPQALAHPER